MSRNMHPDWRSFLTEFTVLIERLALALRLSAPPARS
jgi:hypothetical protein